MSGHFIFSILTTLLKLHLVFAAPQPIPTDVVQEYGPSPANLPDTSSLQAFGPSPVSSRGNSSVQAYELRPVNLTEIASLEKRLTFCPRGSHYGGSVCLNVFTREYICENDNGQIVHRVHRMCPVHTICILVGLGISFCMHNSNSLRKKLYGTRSLGSAVYPVKSSVLDVKSAVINNYYGPNGAPFPVYRTSFLGQPGATNQFDAGYGTAAGSNIIDWRTLDHVEIRVLDFQSQDVTIISFLFGVTFTMPPDWNALDMGNAI